MMRILLILVPFSMTLAGIFFYLFIRATQSGQFDDLETPAQKILLDD